MTGSNSIASYPSSLFRQVTLKEQVRVVLATNSMMRLYCQITPPVVLLWPTQALIPMAASSSSAQPTTQRPCKNRIISLACRERYGCRAQDSRTWRYLELKEY